MKTLFWYAKNYDLYKSGGPLFWTSLFCTVSRSFFLALSLPLSSDSTHYISSISRTSGYFLFEFFFSYSHSVAKYADHWKMCLSWFYVAPFLMFHCVWAFSFFSFSFSCYVFFFFLLSFLGYWVFGAQFCDTWVAFDVMCSTASILNLCAISLDRYIHIKDPLR